MRDTKYCTLFINCLCHLELGVPQQLKLLQWLGMIHRSRQDKETMLFALYCAFYCNFGLSKLHNPSAISFVVIHTCTFIAGCHDG